MRPAVLLLVTMILAALAWMDSAFAEKRVTLVIGIDARVKAVVENFRFHDTICPRPQLRGG
jgi:hypothetical protein